MNRARQFNVLKALALLMIFVIIISKSFSWVERIRSTIRRLQMFGMYALWVSMKEDIVYRTISFLSNVRIYNQQIIPEDWRMKTNWPNRYTYLNNRPFAFYSAPYFIQHLYAISNALWASEVKILNQNTCVLLFRRNLVDFGLSS